jgi:hypothetical protein
MEMTSKQWLYAATTATRSAVAVVAFLGISTGRTALTALWYPLLKATRPRLYASRTGPIMERQGGLNSMDKGGPANASLGERSSGEVVSSGAMV